MMRITEIIEKKKKGQALTREEIFYVVEGAMKGTVTDYQLTALFMAIYFKSMDINETTWMTEATVKSGKILDLSKIGRLVVDKHSSGGVGDKVTLVYLPLLAACRIPLAKLSGKGLGHTGGTIDKLNSIPGFNCELELDDFIKKVKEVGLAIASQTHDLTPADGKFYALRDVTSTIDIIPLIAVSIISKKIASGANFIVLDVKCGEGAFVKNIKDALNLSNFMVEIGKKLGRKICAVITNMNEPLGRTVGNAMEVVEAIEFLKGNYEKDLKEITFELAAQTLLRSGLIGTKQHAIKLFEEAISSGAALRKFKAMIEAQGGDVSVIDDYSKLPQPKKKVDILSPKEGVINHVKALEIAKVAKMLGAGRDKIDEPIDYAVGVYLHKKAGDLVKENEVLATLYVNSEENLEEAKVMAQEAFVVQMKPKELQPLIMDVIA